MSLSLFQVLLENSDQEQQMTVSYDRLLATFSLFRKKKKKSEAAESYIDLHKLFLIIKTKSAFLALHVFKVCPIYIFLNVLPLAVMGLFLRAVM